MSVLQAVQQLPGSLSLYFYINLRIILAQIFKIFGNIVFALVIAANFTTVSFFWVSINCASYLPHLVIFWIAVIGIAMFLYAGVLLATAGTANVMLNDMIKKNLEALFCRRYDLITNRYCNYLKWKSQPTIGVPCGSFFIIDRSFTMTYYGQLMDNLVNGVLLIKPS